MYWNIGISLIGVFGALRSVDVSDARNAVLWSRDDLSEVKL